MSLELKSLVPTATAFKPDGRVKVEMEIYECDLPKLQAWMNSDTWEMAQKIRAENHAGYIKSLEHCVEMALQDHGGARVMAQFLCSLYNGTRVKADVSGIGNLDLCNFEHLMNVLRLCYETNSEPHSFFVDGNAVFERIIRSWKLERRAR